MNFGISKYQEENLVLFYTFNESSKRKCSLSALGTDRKYKHLFILTIRLTIDFHVCR